jgi:hypothetical protein
MTGAAFQKTLERQRELKELVVSRIEAGTDPTTGGSQPQILVESAEPDSTETETIGVNAGRSTNQSSREAAIVQPLIEEGHEREATQGDVTFFYELPVDTIPNHREWAWASVLGQCVSIPDLPPPHRHAVGGGRWFCNHQHDVLLGE